MLFDGDIKRLVGDQHIKIDKGVPQPNQFPFAMMEVGDSFFTKRRYVRNAAYYHGLSNDRKYKCMTVTENGVKGMRVWRIEAPPRDAQYGELPMCDHPYYTREIRGVTTLSLTVAWLIDRSQWFSVEPLPADYWQVCVKMENREAIDNWLDGGPSR